MPRLRLSIAMLALAALCGQAAAQEREGVRLFAPAPAGKVELDRTAVADWSWTPAADRRGTESEAGPAALLLGTDAHWSVSPSQASSGAKAPWQVAAQTTAPAATAAPRPIITQAPAEPWQVAPQATTSTSPH